MFQERAGGFTPKTLFLFFLIFLSSGASVWAAENTACLKCHGNPRLSKGAKDGSLISLYVDEDAFMASVHGIAGVGCTECHTAAQVTFHPVVGFPPPNCAACHPEAAAAFQKTIHGMLLESGSAKAPRCWDCHTAHYVRKKGDPQSSVNATHLPAVCGQCHEEAKPPQGFFAELATYRIMGHRKVNLGMRYDTRGCGNCHPENTGHPQGQEKAPVCLRCHDPSADTPLLTAPIHFRRSFTEQPVPFLLRYIYEAGLGIVVIGGICFLGYRMYRRRKRGQENTGPPKPSA